MPGFYIHNSANDRPDPITHVLGASQTYKPGDPVRVAANLLVVCDTDTSKVLDTELIGFAAQGAKGTESDTRTGLSYGGGPGGATQDSPRSFYPATPSLLIRTRNFWATGAPGTQQAKVGTLRGDFLQISSTNPAGGDAVSQWGVENTAGVPNTDAVAQVVDVLGEDLQPIASGATLTAGTGWLVFRIVGNNQWTGSTAEIAS